MTLPDIANGIVVTRPDIGQRSARKHVCCGIRQLGFASLMMLFSTSMGFADAFTYVGTQGSAEIVLELTEPDDGPMLARYTKKTVGVDFPLTPIETGANRTILKDEKQSARTTALWMLEGPVGNPTLTGTWQVPELGYSLKMSLVRVGSRLYEHDRFDPYGSFSELPAGRIDLGTTPYEFSKMQGNDDEPRTMSGGLYYMVSDPRTKFAFPRVLELRNGASTRPINDALRHEHWRIGLEALDCLARTGTLGGYDEQTVKVHRLSARIMSITPGCGDHLRRFIDLHRPRLPQSRRDQGGTA